MASKGARATAGKVSKKGAGPLAKAAPAEAKPAAKKAAPPKTKANGAPAKAAATVPKIVSKAKTAAAKKDAAKAAPKVAKAAPKVAKAAPKVAKAAPKVAKAAPKAVKSSSAKAPAPKAEKKAAAKKTPEAPRAEAPKKAKAAKAPKAPKAQAESASIESSTVSLEAGDSVPEVELVDHDGNPFSLASLKGQSYVLYFYPKDDTPGCTREACAFRDDIGMFDGANVRVVGVSPDKPESHVRFRDKYGLSFTLLSDVDKVAANAFGVWVKKQNYGREYMGIERSTFLIDEDGKVKKVWRNVKVDGHSQAVLSAAS
jgi:peroxiredoxin Q/BCP